MKIRFGHWRTLRDASCVGDIQTASRQGKAEHKSLYLDVPSLFEILGECHRGDPGRKEDIIGLTEAN
jgi:hypothetical protein